MKQKQELTKKEVMSKIVEKKEFNSLPKKDVEMVMDLFLKEGFFGIELVKKSRELLMKMYTVFMGQKILGTKERIPEWFLKKHVSTKERLEDYGQVYEKSLKGMKKINIYDLGCGVNGFSYDYFKKLGFEANYVGIEAVGQLVDLQNKWFMKEKKKAKCLHESLFNLEKIKEIIKKDKGKKVVFLFKTLDSLEMLKRNYSKKFLGEIVPLVDRVVVSWATKSLISKKGFFATKKWLREFIEKNFKVIDEFEAGIEHYVIFEKKVL